MHLLIGSAVLVAGICCFWVAMGIMISWHPRWAVPSFALALVLGGLAFIASLTGVEVVRHHVQYNPVHVAEELRLARGLALNHKTMTIQINEPGTEMTDADTTYTVQVTTNLPTYASINPVSTRMMVSAGDFPRISHSLCAYRNGWLVFMVPNRSPARYFRPANILDSCRAELSHP